MNPDDLPSDADGDAIQGVLSRGSTASEPMNVDFHIGCPTEEIAEQIAGAIPCAGYETEMYIDDEDPDDPAGWTVEATRSMLLTYDGVIRCQKELAEAAAEFGCKCEAWGTFGNAPTNASQVHAANCLPFEERKSRGGQTAAVTPSARSALGRSRASA